MSSAFSSHLLDISLSISAALMSPMLKDVKITWHFTQNVGPAPEGVNPSKRQGIVKLSLSFLWESRPIETVFWKRPVECNKDYTNLNNKTKLDGRGSIFY